MSHRRWPNALVAGSLIAWAAALPAEEPAASISARWVIDLSGGGAYTPPTPPGALKVGSMDRAYAMSYGDVK